MASPRIRFGQALANAFNRSIDKCTGASSIGDRLAHAGCRAYSIAGAGGTIALIKQLRERTGAPMKDVKAILQQCEWDPEAAFTELRKKGLAAASKKAGRVAADGLLGVAQEGRTAAVVEINSETDFVARNDLFQHLVSQVAKAALGIHPLPTSPWEADIISLDALREVKVVLSHPKLQGESTVEEAVAEVGSIMGENVRLRRGFQMTSSSSGILCSYLHSTSHPGLARIVGLLTLEREEKSKCTPVAELQALGSSLTMHVVAQRPLFLSKETISTEALQRERDILKSQALASGKPEKFVEKMVDGRIRKYMEDVALLEQKYILEDTKTVLAVLNDFSKQHGGKYTIGRFLRMEVGEGIERIEKDFASEMDPTSSVEKRNPCGREDKHWPEGKCTLEVPKEYVLRSTEYEPSEATPDPSLAAVGNLEFSPPSTPKATNKQDSLEEEFQELSNSTYGQCSAPSTVSSAAGRVAQLKTQRLEEAIGSLKALIQGLEDLKNKLVVQLRQLQEKAQ